MEGPELVAVWPSDSFQSKLQKIDLRQSEPAHIKQICSVAKWNRLHGTLPWWLCWPTVVCSQVLNSVELLCLKTLQGSMEEQKLPKVSKRELASVCLESWYQKLTYSQTSCCMNLLCSDSLFPGFKCYKAFTECLPELQYHLAKGRSRQLSATQHEWVTGGLNQLLNDPLESHAV